MFSWRKKRGRPFLGLIQIVQEPPVTTTQDLDKEKPADQEEAQELETESSEDTQEEAPSLSLVQKGS